MQRKNLILIGILAALLLVGVASIAAASPSLNQSGGNTCSSQMMGGNGMGGTTSTGTMGMMGSSRMSGDGNMQCYRAS